MNLQKNTMAISSFFGGRVGAPGRELGGGIKKSGDKKYQMVPKTNIKG